MDKIFSCTIYTTSNLNSVENELPLIRRELCKASGVSDIQFSLVQIDLKKLPPYIRSSSSTGTNWDWFKEHITDEKADMEVVHITSQELQNMGLVHPSGLMLGGEYDVDSDDTMDCLVGAAPGTPSLYPEYTEFQRIMIHEFCHGFSHWTTNNAMGWVHAYDDGIKKGLLPLLPGTFDFRKHTLMTRIRDLLKELVSRVSKRPTLLEAAEKFLGKDASPLDAAPDEYGCADSMTEIIKTIYPLFKGSTSTATLKRIFDTDSRFTKVISPSPDTIIICATGESDSKTVRNGHVGVIGNNEQIMSNSSATGNWTYNYTLSTWNGRWKNAGYPVHYYKIT